MDKQIKNFKKILKANSSIIALFVVLILGAYLRYSGLNWDNGAHLHPDERYITLTGINIERPASFEEYLDPQTSRLAPANNEYGSYIYGTFPLFFAKEIAHQHDSLCAPEGSSTEITEADGFWRSSLCLRSYNSDTNITNYVKLGSYSYFNLLGRFLSATFDLGSIVLIYWIGNNLKKKYRMGIYAAALYSVTTFAIQQSHFFTPENFETFWILVSFVFVIKLSNTKSRKYSLLFAIFLSVSFGIALASKLSAIVFLPIILAAIAINFIHQIPKLHFLRSLVFSLSLLGYMIVISYATFRLLQPYVFAHANWLEFKIHPEFLRAFNQQRSAIAGEFMFPPQWQWVSTTPFWFPFKNIIVWGLGLPLGLGVLFGMGMSIIELIRGLKKAKRKHHLLEYLASPTLLAILWILGSFFYRGGQFVKTMRYFFALLPFLILLFVNALFLIRQKHKQAFISIFSVVFGLSLFWALAFTNIYRNDTTRVAASKWIYQNIPDDKYYANEHWDDAIPFGTRGVEVVYYQNSQEVQVYNQESEKTPIKKHDDEENQLDERDEQLDLERELYLQDEKINMLYDKISQVDYVFVTSNRARGSIGQLPEYYPVISNYYEKLDSGELGFELVHTEKSYPKFLGIEIKDESAEEAFWVYDHPTVRIYKKTTVLDFEQFSQELKPTPSQ